MAQNTDIEYLDQVANPYPGCKPISEGCLNCWAEETAKTRLRGQFGYPLDDPFKPGIYRENWYKRMAKYNKIIGINFMGDLFGNWIKVLEIEGIVNILAHWPYITTLGLDLEVKNRMLGNHKNNNYLFLTKRYNNMALFLSWLKDNRNHLEKLIKPNSYWGFSVCNSQDLKKAYRWMRDIRMLDFNGWYSLEPLIERIPLGTPYFSLHGSKWVIAGGESGKMARPCKVEWVQEIRNYCLEYNIPFFFKGWGKHRPAGQEEGKLDGKEYHEYPEGLKC